MKLHKLNSFNMKIHKLNSRKSNSIDWSKQEYPRYWDYSGPIAVVKSMTDIKFGSEDWTKDMPKYILGFLPTEVQDEVYEELNSASRGTKVITPWDFLSKSDSDYIKKHFGENGLNEPKYFNIKGKDGKSYFIADIITEDAWEKFISKVPKYAEYKIEEFTPGYASNSRSYRFNSRKSNSGHKFTGAGELTRDEEDEIIETLRDLWDNSNPLDSYIKVINYFIKNWGINKPLAPLGEFKNIEEYGDWVSKNRGTNPDLIGNIENFIASDDRTIDYIDQLPSEYNSRSNSRKSNSYALNEVYPQKYLVNLVIDEEYDDEYVKEEKRKLRKEIDDYWTKRIELAKDPKTSKEVLDKLASLRIPGGYFEVRHAVVEHPNVSKTTLEKLANDSDLSMRMKARNRLKSMNSRIHKLNSRSN